MKKNIKNSTFLALFVLSLFGFSPIYTADVGEVLDAGIAEGVDSALGDALSGMDAADSAALTDAISGSAQTSADIDGMASSLNDMEEGGLKTAMTDAAKGSLSEEVESTVSSALNDLKDTPGNFDASGKLTDQGAAALKEKLDGAFGNLQDDVYTGMKTKLEAGGSFTSAEIDNAMSDFQEGATIETVPTGDVGGGIGDVEGGIPEDAGPGAVQAVEEDAAAEAVQGLDEANGGNGIPEYQEGQFQEVQDNVAAEGGAGGAEANNPDSEGISGNKASQKEYYKQKLDKANETLQSHQDAADQMKKYPGRKNYYSGKSNVKINAVDGDAASYGEIENAVKSGNFSIEPDGTFKIDVDGTEKSFTLNASTEEGGDSLFEDGKFTDKGEYLADSISQGNVSFEDGTFTFGTDGPPEEFTEGDLSQTNLKSLEDSRDSFQQEVDSRASTLDRVGRGIKDGAKWVGKKIWATLEFAGGILIQAVLFTVPSIMYQQTVGKEKMDALRATISSPQQFGDIWLQIPPDLVSQGDPLRSSFVYCPVPDGTKQDSGYFNTNFLRTTNFYVTYNGAYQPWGSTYIGSESYTGQMVVLNNGFGVVATGVPINSAAPTFALRPDTKNTVEEFVNEFVSKSGAKEEVSVSDLEQWIPYAVQKAAKMDTGPKEGTASGNPVIKALFSTPAIETGTKTTGSVDLLTGGKFTPAPLIFANAITAFRKSWPLSQFGGIKLRQMEGTGYLNALLNPGVDWSNAGIQEALLALKKAEDAYSTTMATLATQSVSGDGATAIANMRKIQTDADATLTTAQSNLATALKNSGVPGVSGGLGFYPQEDINTRGIYVYEIDAGADQKNPMTPSLETLLKNQMPMPSVSGSSSSSSSSQGIPNYVPVKEYMVCLNSGFEIQPLLTPSVQDVSNSGKNGLKYDVAYALNPQIQYITSLTTGITYQVSSAAKLTPVRNSAKALDFSIAANTFDALSKQIGSLTGGGNYQGILNQIVSMATYTTNKAIDGPFVTVGGNVLKEVPLAKLDAGATVAAKESNLTHLSSVFNNTITASSLAMAGRVLPDTGPNAKSTLWPNMHVYAVYKSDGKTGVLSGADATGTQLNIPDYVVPIASQGSATTFQIMPLGADQITGGYGGNGVQMLLSLITGQVYDTQYLPISRSYTIDVIPRDTNGYYPLSGSTAGSYEGATLVTSSETIDVMVAKGKMVSEKVKMIPNIWLGDAYMPTHYNPNNRVINAPYVTQYNTLLSTISTQKSSIETGGGGSALLTYALNALENGGAAQLKADGFPAAVVTAAEALKSSYDSLQTLMQTINTNPSATTWKTDNQLLNIPPLYFTFFSSYSLCTSGANTYQTSKGLGVAGSQNTLSWVNTQPCAATSVSPIAITVGTGSSAASHPVPLAGALPNAFSGINWSEVLTPSQTSQGQTAQTKFYNGATDSDTGTFYPSIIAAYTNWTLIQDNTDYWVQSGYMAPINFTQRSTDNVYLTATSREDVKRGNFFYHASGFPSSSLFVWATGPANGVISSIDDLQNIGHPAVAGQGLGSYIIEIGTGRVYTPYIASGSAGSRLSTPTICCFPDSIPYPAQGSTKAYNKPASEYKYALGQNCSLQPVGQNVFPGGNKGCSSLSLQGIPSRTGVPWVYAPSGKVYDSATLLAQVKASQGAFLKTKGATGSFTASQGYTPTLQLLINNAVTAGEQKMNMNLGPHYFNGMKLYLTADQIASGTYIYSVSSAGSPDYLVVWQVDGSTLTQVGNEPVTPYTSQMISLVTGTLYNKDGTVVPNYYSTTFTVPKTSNVGYELLARVEQGPAVPSGASAKKATISTTLASTITALSIAHAKQVAQMNTTGGALVPGAPTFPTGAQTIVNSLGYGISNADMPHLVKIGSKYFLKMTSTVNSQSTPSSSSAQSSSQTSNSYTIYFDFNATTAGKDAGIGVYYQVEAQTNTAPGTSTAETSNVAEPVSSLSGFELNTMRLAHGVSVSSAGVQSLNVPVGGLSIPLGKGETTLLKVDSSGAPVASTAATTSVLVPALSGGTTPLITTNTAQGQKYYFYRHTQLNAYFALVQDTRGMVVGTNPNVAGAPKKTTVYEPSYLVDLISGNQYDLTGKPRLQKVTAAYALVNKPLTVINSSVSAPALPLADLTKATAVGGTHPNLYKVNNKYFLKAVIKNAPLVNQNGQTPSTGATTGTVTRYFDFNSGFSSAASTSPTTDLGCGAWYQIVGTGTSQKAVPIDSVSDNSFSLNPLGLTNMRAYYGVQVASSTGAQTLIPPIAGAIDMTRAAFVWSTPTISGNPGSFNVVCDASGSGTYTLYNYVPYSTVLKFAKGTQFQFIKYSTTGSGTTLAVTAQKSVSTPTTRLKPTVTTLAPSSGSNTTGMTNNQKASQAYIDAMNAAQSDGWILFGIERQVSPTSSADSSITVEQGMMSPTTYTIKGEKYVDGSTITPSATTITPYTPQNVALLGGTPFVSRSLGARTTTTSNPTGVGSFGTPICGVLSSSNNALLNIVTSTLNGSVYSYNPPQGKSSEPVPAQVVAYGSASGETLYGVATNYPVNPSAVTAGMSQGQYIGLSSGFTVSATAPQSIYEFDYSYVSDSLLNAIKSQVNVVATNNGTVMLEQSVALSSKSSITVPSGSIGRSYLALYTTPTQTILYQIPPASVVSAYYSSDKTTYLDANGKSVTALQNFNNIVGVYSPGTYIDYTTGAVFTLQDNAQGVGTTLYPTGFTIGAAGLNLIRAQFGGAIPYIKSGQIQLKTPAQAPNNMATTVPQPVKVTPPTNLAVPSS